jgi:hypothetical protein
MARIYARMGKRREALEALRSFEKMARGVVTNTGSRLFIPRWATMIEPSRSSKNWYRPVQ